MKKLWGWDKLIVIKALAMWLKIQLYILSLVFLFALLLANQLPICFGPNCSFIGVVDLLLTWPPIILFCCIGLLVSLLIYYNFKYRIEKAAPSHKGRILEIESLNFENLTFLATYIIPLVCFDLDFHLTEGRNFFMLLLVLILIGWIYVKTNIFYTNPTLAVLNFKIYKVKIHRANKDVVEQMIIVTKFSLKVDDFILPNRMDDNIFFATKYNPDEITNRKTKS